MDEPLSDCNGTDVANMKEMTSDTVIAQSEPNFDTNEQTALLLPDEPDVSNAAQDDEHIEEETSSVVDSSAKSLAWAPTTPRIARWLIPLCALVTHGLFLYGQIQPMWRLTQTQSIDVWWNATSIKSRWAFDTVGLAHEQHLVRHEGSTIQTFTYSFAIQELWEAKGMPSSTMARIAAVLLALFSGVWPHLKLLLLNLTWLGMKNPVRRTRSLHWLSCLGKWSLADILVVCVMVGVLHIDWNVNPEAIRDGISDNLPELLRLVQTQYTGVDLCTMLLHMDCEHPSKVGRRVKCDTCNQFFVAAFHHPGWAGSTGKAILNGVSSSGEGVCSLRVIGMGGIYVFCAAVVISILLSLVVDVFDHQAREYDLMASTPVNLVERQPLIEGDAENGDVDAHYSLMEDEVVDERHLGGAQRTSLDVEISRTHDLMRIPMLCFKCSHAFFSFLVLILVFIATHWITMERQVKGAIPMLLSEILGMEWGKSYSLQTLSQTTGAAGGWDVLLMYTFSLFIVFGPLFRSSLCILGHILPGRIATIQIFVDLIGAFCAWEVLVIAVAMIYMLMPSITGTILMDDRCHEVDPTGSCFEVEFNVRNAFLLVLVSGTVLVLISNTFSYFARTSQVRR